MRSEDVKRLYVKVTNAGSAVSHQACCTVGLPSEERLTELYAKLSKIVAEFNDETMKENQR